MVTGGVLEMGKAASLKRVNQELDALHRIYDQWKLERGLLQVPVVPASGMGPSPIEVEPCRN